MTKIQSRQFGHSRNSAYYTVKRITRVVIKHIFVLFIYFLTINFTHASDKIGVSESICIEYIEGLYVVVTDNVPNPENRAAIDALSEYIGGDPEMFVRCLSLSSCVSLDQESLTDLMFLELDLNIVIDSYLKSIVEIPEVKDYFFSRVVKSHTSLKLALKTFNKALKTDAERAGAV